MLYNYGVAMLVYVFNPSGGRSRHDIPTQNISAAKLMRWDLAKVIYQFFVLFLHFT
jgi:hypothetical protein